MNYVFMYAGQGSQKAGMGKDLYETCTSYRELVDALPAAFDLKKLMHEGPEEELSKTMYTQPCLAAFQAGVTAALRAEGVKPAAAVGLSLGEYSALSAAGVFTPEQVFRVTAFRGQAMQEAAEGLSCSMSAVIGAENDLIEEACRGAMESGSGFVAAVNYNCPGQTVICGDEAAVAGAEERIRNGAKARFIRLKVSGPFHTHYMAPAGEKLLSFLKKPENSPGKPEIPVAANVTGTFYGPEDDIAWILSRQIKESVKLEQNLRALLSEGYTDFLEIGPGNTMSGFLKKTARALKCPVNCVSISTAEELTAFLESRKDS